MRLEPEEKDVFPINIPEHLKNVRIGDLNVSPRLEYILQDHEISTLGQLNGMESGDFLEWHGFGAVRLNSLIEMISMLPKY